MKKRFPAVCSLLLLVALQLAYAAGPMVQIPAYGGPAQASAKQQTALLAGGCFWGVQAVFQHLKGVTRAESGYAGGEAETADYDRVSSGRTGHAEAVQVTFDPSIVSYARILQIYFSVVHDPTQLNRQGPDVGTQYRSAIFPIGAEQGRIAREYIAQLNRAQVYRAAIVTKLEPGAVFFPAESYHQDFLFRNPRHAYIVQHDLPKLEGLKRYFPDDYLADPVLIRTPVRKK